MAFDIVIGNDSQPNSFAIVIGTTAGSTPFADGVYPAAVRRRSVAARSAARPSYFGPTTIVAPAPPLPVYADAVYAVPAPRRRPAPSRSAARPSFFWNPSTPAPPPTVTFVDAVYPPVVKRRKEAGRSATRPSFFGPVDPRFNPTQLIGAVPFVQPQKIQRLRSRSHLRPSFFGAPLLIADTPITPLYPSGTVLAPIVEAGSHVTFSWVTDVMKSWSGLEQRVSINRWPRLHFDFTAQLTDAEQRRILSTLAGSAAAAPLFLLGLAHEDMTVVSSAGTAITVPSLARCDWAQAGRRVVVVHRQTGAIADGIIQSASGAVITTTADLSATAVAGSRIMPAHPVYLDPAQVLSRYRTARGAWQLAAWAERPLSVPIVGVGATVTTHDGLAVWDQGNMSEQASQPLRSGVDLVDMGGRIGSLANFTEADWGRQLRFEGRGAADFQWLKAFLDVVRGRQVAFLLPTGRPDLTVHTNPAGSTFKIHGPPTTDAPDYVNSWFPSLAHRRLRLTLNGATVYVTITGAIDNGDGTQTLTMSAPQTGTIARIEFLEQVRLDTDDVTVQFGGAGSFATDLPCLVVQR